MVAAWFLLAGILVFISWDRIVALIPIEWLISDLDCPADAPADTPDLGDPLTRQGRACVASAALSAVGRLYVRPEQLAAMNWVLEAERTRRAALDAGSDADFYAQLKAQYATLGDRHTAFYTPDEAARQLESVKATYAGPTLAAALRPVERGLLVVEVLPGGSAEAAGLRRGDVIETVDGRACPAGCEGRWDRTVALGLSSPHGKRRVTIVQQPYKGEFRVNGWHLPDGGAYVRIPNFVSANIARSFDKVVEAILDKGTPGWLIIDVRSNGGGLREQLTPVLGALLPEGTYGLHRSPDGEVRPFDVADRTLSRRLRSVPLVVLVDAGTKSAAELFASMLQAERRAIIVGERTTGETEGVEVFDLPDGSRVSISAREFYLRGAARPLSTTGIIPDIATSRRWYDRASPVDPDMQAAIELMAPRAARRAVDPSPRR